MKRFALVLACVLSAVSFAKASPVVGSGSQTDLAYSNDIVTYDVAYFGGETSGVHVHGDGSTDLDLFVYDQFGNLVASDMSFGNDSLVIWTPNQTGIYTIAVVNAHGIPNRFTIDFV